MTQTTSYTTTRIAQIIEAIQSNRQFIQIITTENANLDATQMACIRVAGAQIISMEEEYATLTGTSPVHHTAITG
jgi:hypothetical protein